MSAPPAWAADLAPQGQAALAHRAVRLAASGWADAERMRRAVARLLDAGRDPGVAEVLAAVEAESRAKSALAAAEATDEAGRALLEAGARVVLAGCAGYPPRLADAWPDLGAPAWLFVRSGAGLLPEGPAVAVVGTRHPTIDGLATARELGRRLAAAGVTVVSGMARGIDQAAHRGALDGGGRTVGVLGAGLDVDYPRGDAAMREEVAAAGGLVTEYACGTPPRPPHFLARNRIIAGLADLTVVVEGQARSGSLQTARLAAAQGREVWAVPGSVRAPTSRGPLDLIRDGAQIVTRLDDVLEALDALPPRAHDPPSGDLRRGLPQSAVAVHSLLGPVPATPGALAAASGLPVAEVLTAISELTACGLAASTPRGVVATAWPPGTDETVALRPESCEGGAVSVRGVTPQSNCGDPAGRIT